MHHLGKDELLALFAAAAAERERDWLLFLVAFWHGLRASEVTALTAENFEIEREPNHSYIVVQRLKGSMRTRQPLTVHGEHLLNERAALERYIRTVDWPSGLLFPISVRQVQRLMVKHGRAAGLPRHLCHPHVLKHSCAVYLLRELGLGIDVVRQWLGHTTISSTGEYLELTDEEAGREIDDALKRGPRQKNLFGDRS